MNITINKETCQEMDIIREPINSQKKEVIELTVTLEMLWSYWISRTKWPMTNVYLKGPFEIVKSLLTILPDFIDDEHVKLTFAEYHTFLIYLLKIDNSFSYYYILCNCLFSGEIANFFRGSCGENISQKILDNNTLMGTYFETINRLTNEKPINILKEGNSMRQLSYHLSLTYIYEIYKDKKKQYHDNLSYKKSWSEIYVFR